MHYFHFAAHNTRCLHPGSNLSQKPHVRCRFCQVFKKLFFGEYRNLTRQLPKFDWKSMCAFLHGWPENHFVINEFPFSVNIAHYRFKCTKKNSLCIIQGVSCMKNYTEHRKILSLAWFSLPRDLAICLDRFFSSAKRSFTNASWGHIFILTRFFPNAGKEPIAQSIPPPFHTYEESCDMCARKDSYPLLFVVVSLFLVVAPKFPFFNAGFSVPKSFKVL